MRVLGLVGLVLVLAIVGFTLKKQLAAVAPAPAPTAQAQGQQIQQQIKEQLDATLSQPRALPDEP